MEASGQPFAGAKILLVEDDPQAVGILEPILISKGFSVAVARDGVEGLEKVKLLSPDILLLDVNMPRMDGIELCRRIKSEDSIRLTPVVMLTALSDLEKKLEALEAGADDFVNKPYNMVELVTRIKSLLKVKYLNEQLETAPESVRYFPWPARLKPKIPTRKATWNGFHGWPSAWAIIWDLS